MGDTERLASAICDLYREGVTVNGAARDFIDSTFFNPSLEDLVRLLREEDDDAAPVFELLLFPDAAQQTALEPLISACDFGESDPVRVAGMVHGRMPRVMIRYASADTPLPVPVPRWVMDLLVSRLNITCRIDPRVGAAITAFRAVPDLQMRLRVLLRNSRLEPDEKQVRVLVNFLNRSGSASADFMRRFAFLVGFVAQVPADAEIYGALMARKRACFRSLQQTLKLEQMMREGNMETLLMRGVRIVHGDKAQLRQTMADIDAISEVLFGRTEPIDSPCSPPVPAESRVFAPGCLEEEG